MLKEGYQKNKYLDDLGIPIIEYGTNFCNRSDKRWKKWRREREEYGFDERECWNLDTTFVEWLYSHFMKYAEDSRKVVNLEYLKFEYQGNLITQAEAINTVCEACKEYLTSDFLDRTFLSKDIMMLITDLMPAMWW